jgi:hypothetical protein
MTGAIVADVVRDHEAAPDLFAAARDHVRAARREEAALGCKLGTGLFGAASAGRPWPEHDAALCRDYEHAAARSWLFAVQCLLEALARRP